MVSIFKTLGEFIAKYAWGIIALWVVILLISAPMALMFTQNLEYDTEKFVPKDLGAFQAKDVYDAQFPANDTNQILIVAQSDNKTESMHFIDALNSAVKNDSSIKNVTGTTSIYDIQRSALVNMTPDLYRGLYEGYDNVTDANRELYNATDTVRNSSRDLYYLKDNITKANDQMYTARKQILTSSAQMYSARDQIVQAHDGLYQVKGAADMILGVPMRFVQAYNKASPSLDDANSSHAAYDEVKSSLSEPASSYLNAFYAHWQANYEADPMSRAQHSISSAEVSGFIGAMPSDQQPIMFAVVQNYPLASYSAEATRQFAVNTVGQSVSDPAMKQQLDLIYGMGVSPSSVAYDNMVLGAVPADQQSAAREIYNLGRNPSDGAIGSYLVNKALRSINKTDTNATQIIWDAWNLGGSATNDDFDKYVIDKASKDLNATEKAQVQRIYSWGPVPDNATISAYVLEQAGSGRNASENQTMAEIYDLGWNATSGSVKEYVIDQAKKDANLTSNNTYFLALLSLPRNMTDVQLQSYARDWANTHGYDDPKIFPDSIVSGLAAGKVTLYMVSTSDIENAESSIDAVKAIRGHIASLEGGFPGVTVYLTGASAMSVDTEMASMSDVDNIDKVTIALVLIILGLYFRSFLTPFVPLIIIGVAIVAAFGMMGLISTQIGIFYLVETFMIVIMLGAGTDYCVFMFSRFAEERSKGAEVRDSVVAAVSNAGKSIASSGSTAMIGFGSLMLVDQGIFRSIGIGTATSILLSMLVALTLVPAVLTVFGDKLFWPRKIYKSGPGMTQGIWRKITGRVLKHSKLILAIALLLTIPAIAIFMQLHLGDDVVSMLPANVESKQGYDILNSEFGSGALDKAMIVATMPSLKVDGNYSAASLDRVESLSASIAGVPGVSKVYSITRPEGATISYDDLSSYSSTEKEYYQTYMDNSTGKDGRTTVLYVEFVGSPYSESSQRAIDAIQTKLADYQQSPDGQGTTLLLGGSCVATYEYQKAATDKYSLVIPVVLIGIFLVLMLLLRSVFTPLRLIMTLLMSMMWTLAAFIVVFVFWMQTSVYWILPIILFCVLMGLGVDYDIFLVSRIKEEVMKGRSDEDAIEHAVESTGTIITLCGTVMAAAFGSMLLSNMIMLREFGFVLCLAIILDATIMRLVVVPSIMVLMKKYNWWMPFVKDEVAPVILVKK
jgi:RND superfamily putative drug exporter